MPDALPEPDHEDPPRLSIIDDVTAIRTAIPSLMSSVRFISSHDSVENFLDRSPRIDLAIIDLPLVNERQPDAQQGLAAVEAVVEAGYPVCVYTQEERPFVLASCLAAGALGIVSKSLPLAEAQSAFLSAAAGELVAPRAVVAILEVLSKNDHPTLLSPRQREV